MSTSLWKFNIRVYALILNEKDEILLTDEERYDTRMTKFPGGGLIPGEGTIDCLHREAIEEFGQDIKILRHYYTTDFFQQALFHEDQQLISIYYLAQFSETIRFRISQTPFDFKKTVDEPISFRFMHLHDLKPSDLSFPIDRRVLQLLQEEDQPSFPDVNN